MNGHAEAPRPIDIVDAILDFAHFSHALPPGDPAAEEASYQATFTPDAEEKADRVVEFVRQCRPAVDPARVVYVSLGGGDGAEIAHAMRVGGFRRGLLLEWMGAAAEVGKEHARRLKAEGRGELRVVTGDAAQHLEGARRSLREWREQPGSGVDGLLISAQAVLHELPDRADPRRYHFQKVCALYDGFPVRLFHSREPCRPWADCGWADKVQFKAPGVPAEKLAAACSLLLEHYSTHFPGIGRETVFAVGDGFVEAPGPVVVEFLHKFLRFKERWNLRHEMQECLVSLDPKDLHERLATVFGGMRQVTVEPTVTEGFRQAYLRFDIRARRAARVTEELPVPMAFATFKAFSADKSGDLGGTNDRHSSDASPESDPGREQPTSAAASTQGCRKNAKNPDDRESGDVILNIGTVNGPVIGKQIIQGDQHIDFRPRR